MKKIIYLLMLLFAISFSAQKIDKVRFSNITKQLKLKSIQIKENLVIEKKMPNGEDSYVVVLPILISKHDDEGFTVRNTILITNSEGIIKNQFIDQDEYVSDAIALYSFIIDTGIYNLDTNTRAFAIIANYLGNSQPNPYSESNTSMYYPVEKTLKKVLNQFQVAKFGGEWDTNCAGNFYEKSSVIIVEKAKTNGFANLKIKTEDAILNSKVVNGDCTESKKTKTTVKVLKFNKSTYQ